MLTLEIFEADDKNPYKTIYYRDADDIAIRMVQIDEAGYIVIDEISEFNQQKQLVSITRYGRDLVTVLACRECQFNDEGKKIGFTDYKRVGGVLKMICRCEFIAVVPGRLSKDIWFDANNQPTYCQYFINEEKLGMARGLKIYDIEGYPLPYACMYDLETFNNYKL